MAKPLRMDEIRNILKTYLRTRSFKQTATQCRCARNTVRTYVRLAQAQSGGCAAVLALDEGAFTAVFIPPTADARRDYFDTQIEYFKTELKRTGVTRQLLWEEYQAQRPDGYGYTRFCALLNGAIGQTALTLPIQHRPGEKLQLDFTGSTLPWVDVESGQIHDCQVLVAVMPYSHYTFAVALDSQRVADFVHGINEALIFLGGLPRAIVSDNLKSFVIRPDRYEPTFNDAVVQLGLHYEVDFEATRPARPKDKASVENAVATVYTRLFAPLRNRVFHSPAAINAALRDQLTAHNERPYQKREGCRAAVFAAEEKPLLRPLPARPFALRTKLTAKVQKNYHVYLSQRRNFYSVPHRYVGRTAEIVLSQATVEVFVGRQRVAIHERLHSASRSSYRTNPKHMPASHVEWSRAQGWTGEHFRNRAARIGPATAWAMGQVLASRHHEPQSYRACQGVLSLARSYGGDRLEAAAVRLEPTGKAGYRRLKNVLEKGLDRLTDQLDLFTPPAHENIRGPGAYR